MFVNLTPHQINVITPSGVVTIPPSGQVARVTATPTLIGEAGGVPLSRVAFGEVVGLPEPQADTIFVVSSLLRQAVPHRTDVASPGDMVRGEDGQPVGCRGLTVN